MAAMMIDIALDNRIHLFAAPFLFKISSISSRGRPNLILRRYRPHGFEFSYKLISILIAGPGIAPHIVKELERRPSLTAPM
ncbi:MAG: hypothetical protein ACLSDO_01270 [Anaerotruncus colihominis]